MYESNDVAIAIVVKCFHNILGYC